MRLSQATAGISSYLPILLGFECQVMAAVDIISLSISLDCLLYRAFQSDPHEIEYNGLSSNRPHKIPSSLHFGVKVYHSFDINFLLFIYYCVIAFLEKFRGNGRIDLHGAVSMSGFVSVFWSDEERGVTGNEQNLQLSHYQRVSSYTSF